MFFVGFRYKGIQASLWIQPDLKGLEKPFDFSPFKNQDWEFWISSVIGLPAFFLEKIRLLIEKRG
jgi:hypothetical protein